MIVHDDRAPKGRDAGPGRARASYASRGSIPGNRLSAAIPPALAGLRRERGGAVGPASGGWVGLRRRHWVNGGAA
jgi:hypothetical protein